MCRPFGDMLVESYIYVTYIIVTEFIAIFNFYGVTATQLTTLYICTHSLAHSQALQPM